MKTWLNGSVRPDIGWVDACFWMLVAVTSFQAAQEWSLGWLMIPCSYAWIELSRLPTRRQATYALLATGFLCYAPQLGFFWRIFGPGAVALWYVLAFWLALFGLLLHLVQKRFGEMWMLLLAPVIWTGLEYFRSELYYLRFSWLTLGMAHSGAPEVARGIGMYGLGFLTMALAAGLNAFRSIGRIQMAGVLFLAFFVTCYLSPATAFPSKRDRDALPVAGVQLEFQDEHNILRSLDHVIARFPDAKLVMLSEYAFQGPIPKRVRDWCRAHGRYLVAGGKEDLGTNFYDMAYVIGPDGEVVHRQVKSVPIQFFKDGLPAPKREVWHSPWGPIGILVCYDLSYTRVVDDFVRQGARALLAPTMDVCDWGEHQHELHARVAPLRAAEYGIPIFRVCSSGVSQLVSARGRVLASAPFPGDGAMLAGDLSMKATPHLPLDRYLAPFAVVATGLVIATLVGNAWRNRKAKHAPESQTRTSSVRHGLSCELS
jgi:apolipoprotein N-acyltransferase